jgi:hypothetical protein
MFLRTRAISVTTVKLRAAIGETTCQRSQSMPRTTLFRTPNFRPAPTNRNRFPAQRSWPNSLRNGPGPGWSITWNSFGWCRPLRRTEVGQEVHEPQGRHDARIWEAVAPLSPDAAQPAADVAPSKGMSKKAPAKSGRRARAKKGVTETRSNKKASTAFGSRRLIKV